MKQAKRSIMVPEDHYVQLTKLISGNDNVQVEKAKTDLQIQKILNSKISDLVKNVRYNLLSKKRKNLNQTLEKKPTVMVNSIVKALMKEISGKPTKESDVSSTGIVPGTAPKPLLQQIQQRQLTAAPRTPKAAKADPHIEDEDEEESSIIEDEELTAPPEVKSKKLSSLEKNINTVKKFYGKINKKYYDDLKNYLASESSLIKFGISEEGQIYSNVSKAKSGYKELLPGSDVDIVIRILIGQGALPEKSEQLKYIIPFLNRLRKDETLKHMINNDYERPTVVGEGSKYIKRTKNVYVLDVRKGKSKNFDKTKGLVRERINNRVKPLLWTKISV